MTIEEIIEIMSSMNEKVSSITLDKINSILEISSEYSFQGYNFTFDRNADLDTEVNRILLELSDDILSLINKEVPNITPKDDTDGALMYVYNDFDNGNLVERVDRHSSHLKYALEGYLALCFVNKVNPSRMVAEIPKFLSNPYAYTMFKSAVKDNDRDKYTSDIIRSGGYHYGKGSQINPLDGFTIIVQTGINAAYQWGCVQGYTKEGAIGYRVHRNSAFLCPDCDELCEGIHPLTEIVLPAHPRCCCYTTPVFIDDTE